MRHQSTCVFTMADQKKKKQNVRNNKSYKQKRVPIRKCLQYEDMDLFVHQRHF